MVTHFYCFELNINSNENVNIEIKDHNLQTTMISLIDKLNSIEEQQWNKANISSALNQFVLDNNIKFSTIAKSLRFILFGSNDVNITSLDDILVVMEKEYTLERIQLGLEQIGIRLNTN